MNTEHLVQYLAFSSHYVTSYDICYDYDNLFLSSSSAELRKVDKKITV